MVRTRDVLAGIARDVPTTVASAVTDRIFGLTEPLPASGLHTGFVRIPWSSDRSAYGFVPVPLVVAGGGDGPPLLLLAGVFGDEPDAQLGVARIVQSLDPAVMNGRVIAMPMANLPAAAAGPVPAGAQRSADDEGKTYAEHEVGGADERLKILFDAKQRVPDEIAHAAGGKDRGT